MCPSFGSREIPELWADGTASACSNRMSCGTQSGRRFRVENIGAALLRRRGPLPAPVGRPRRAPARCRRSQRRRVDPGRRGPALHDAACPIRLNPQPGSDAPLLRGMKWRKSNFTRLSAGGRWMRTFGTGRGSIFSRPPRNPASKPAGNQNRILTIDKSRFTVHRARLAPAMISTPGHRASRRRQRGALPAWPLFGF
jgi:hypothetical protein